MKVTTYEATVENGQVRLPEGTTLPEHARVFVVVPDDGDVKPFSMMSPRIADPARAADFVLEMTPELPDAGI